MGLFWCMMCVGFAYSSKQGSADTFWKEIGMFPTIIVSAAVVIVLVAIVAARRKARDARRDKLMRAPFPDDWKAHIEKNSRY